MNKRALKIGIIIKSQPTTEQFAGDAAKPYRPNSIVFKRNWTPPPRPDEKT